MSFEALGAEKEEGVDYGIRFTHRDSEVLILAPHGGKIEPWTSEIAQAVARDSYSVYRFEGCQALRNYEDLHITSENFDEPQALEAVKRSKLLVAVHGYRNQARAFVMVGGLDQELRAAVESSLSDAGFAVEPPTSGLRGSSRRNVCNRGQSGRGCQLEISRLLRDELKERSKDMSRFARAIQDAISRVVRQRNEDEA